MEWSAAVRRLLLRRVQVCEDEVLDAIHMSGAGCPVQRRAAVRIDRGAEPVRVRFFEEGQVAGLRGVEHVGVLWCRLFTDHLRLHFFVFEQRGARAHEALRAERVQAQRLLVRCAASLLRVSMLTRDCVLFAATSDAVGTGAIAVKRAGFASASARLAASRRNERRIEALRAPYRNAWRSG